MLLNHTALPRMLCAALWWACGCAFAGPLDDVRALQSRGELAAALATADQGLRAQPQDAGLRFLRGVVLMDLRRDEEALTQFTQLTHEYPELPDPYNNLALLHTRAGRFELARQALSSALLADPRHHAARVNLGRVHLLLAAQAWEMAAHAAPADAAQQRRLQALQAFLASEALTDAAADVPR